MNGSPVIARSHGQPDREGDERYQQLVELAPDAILVHDDEGRIVLANAAATRLAGAVRRSQLVGQPIVTFLNPPWLKAVQAQLTDSIDAHQIAPPVRDSFRRLDGEVVEVEVRAVPFIYGGFPAAHLVVRDVTERLAAEQAARQLDDRLHQAQRNESVGALAGGVAHEVNNMMAVVLGFSEFLLADERLPAECAGDVREIVKAAERAAVVTGQLLAFSGRAVHRPRVVDLGVAVRQAAPLIERLLDTDQQLVVLANAVRATVDPEQLEEVVVSLAMNSRDAMSGGGTLTLTTMETELPDGTAAVDGSAIPEGTYATLLVRDTGVGMDRDLLAQVFEPFFTTRPGGKHTGLGLSAVSGFARQNNGFLTVSSARGRGTTFTLYLPAVPVSAVPVPGAPPTAMPSAPTYSGATVLLVDDESAVRSVAARTLERSGFRVLQAPGAAEALALVARLGLPRIVVTDLTMPGMGGAELARQLKAQWPALPIVYMSGYSAEELRRQGAISSETELVRKPFPPGELVARVISALSQIDAPEPASQ